MALSLRQLRVHGCSIMERCREGVIVLERRSSVLVVEDDGEMRSLLRDGLWGEGYVLREAEDGDEAVLSVLRAAPDLILTELRLATGGVDYIHRLRAFVPHCPIVVMTAFGDDRVRGEVLRAGATAYFSKPVHLTALRSCLNELLEAGRQAMTRCAETTEGVR